MPYITYQFTARALRDTKMWHHAVYLASHNRSVILGSNAHDAQRHPPMNSRLESIIEARMPASVYQNLCLQTVAFFSDVFSWICAHLLRMYFCRVASPPLKCRSDLFCSKIFLAFAYIVGLMWRNRTVMSLCTVLLLTAKTCATFLTVAWCSIRYAASTSHRSSCVW